MNIKHIYFIVGLIGSLAGMYFYRNVIDPFINTPYSSACRELTYGYDIEENGTSIS